MSASCTASLNTKLTPAEKDKFSSLTSELGLSPSVALRIFVCKFNESGGFPFSVQKKTSESSFKINPEFIYTPPRTADGTMILPADWYDPEGEIYNDFA